jgi:hypothetical protein
MRQSTVYNVYSSFQYQPLWKLLQYCCCYIFEPNPANTVKNAQPQTILLLQYSSFWQFYRYKAYNIGWQSSSSYQRLVILLVNAHRWQPPPPMLYLKYKTPLEACQNVKNERNSSPGRQHQIFKHFLSFKRFHCTKSCKLKGTHHKIWLGVRFRPQATTKLKNH